MLTLRRFELNSHEPFQEDLKTTILRRVGVAIRWSQLRVGVRQSVRPTTHVSILGIFRPKWQHPNADVRLAAMVTLTDQALLAAFVEGDESDAVRLAAFQRLTNQSELTRIAKSTSPFNVRAFGGVTETNQIVDVARTAERPQVRSLAVDKIDDAVVLQQIATVDADASVRRNPRNRRFRMGADPMGDFLTGVLSKLQIAEVPADRVAEICGDLSDICVALVNDRRFRINGVLTHGREAAVVALIESTHNPSVPVGVADSSPAQPCYIEFLAAKCGSDGEADNDIHNTVHFRIKIWRVGEKSFHASVQQRRC
jgi:hypothetical protein